MTDRSTADRADESAWSVAETPTDAALYAVVRTVAGPHAVGEDGIVLARADDRDGTDHGNDDSAKWQVVVSDGPGAHHNALNDAGVTADGERVWFAGSSGALGAYDVETDTKYDYSAPMEKTSTWEAIAVTGDRGDERVRVANGSGEVVRGRIDDRGCPEWDAAREPGSGSSIAALAADGERFYVADTDGGTFEETGRDRSAASGQSVNAPETPDPDQIASDPETADPDRMTGGLAADIDISARNAAVDFFDVTATDETVRVAGDDGLVYRYDRACENWTPTRVGESALHALAEEGGEAGTDGESGADGEAGTDGELLVAGEEGRIYRRTPTTGWREVPTPAEKDLWGVAVGDPAVAVGEDGVVVER